MINSWTLLKSFAEKIILMYFIAHFIYTHKSIKYNVNIMAYVYDTYGNGFIISFNNKTNQVLHEKFMCPFIKVIFPVKEKVLVRKR